MGESKPILALLKGKNSMENILLWWFMEMLMEAKDYFKPFFLKGIEWNSRSTFYGDSYFS